MLTIRLQRVGKTKKPAYRLIISEKARDTQDRYLELLGSFNQAVKANPFIVKADRVKYWLGKGAQTSPTVHNLLLKAGIITGKKQKAVFISKKRSAKIAEKSASAKASASVQASADKPADVASIVEAPKIA